MTEARESQRDFGSLSMDFLKYPEAALTKKEIEDLVLSDPLLRVTRETQIGFDQKVELTYFSRSIPREALGYDSANLPPANVYDLLEEASQVNVVLRDLCRKALCNLSEEDFREKYKTRVEFSEERPGDAEFVITVNRVPVAADAVMLAALSEQLEKLLADYETENPADS